MMRFKLLDFDFYNIDCMDGMKEFPDKYFNLAIVDPPYGLGESSKNFESRSILAKPTKYIKKH